MALDRKQVAAIRKLISDADAAVVDQGLQLLAALGDRELWALVADDVDKRVKAAHRRKVRLRAMQGADLHQPSDQLSVTIDELPLLAGTGIGKVTVKVDRPGSFAPLGSCRALSRLELHFAGRAGGRASDVEAIDTLEALRLQAVVVESRSRGNWWAGAWRKSDEHLGALLPSLARIPTLASLCFVQCIVPDLSVFAETPSLTALEIRGGCMTPPAVLSLSRLQALRKVSIRDVKVEGLPAAGWKALSGLPFSWKDSEVEIALYAGQRTPTEGR